MRVGGWGAGVAWGAEAKGREGDIRLIMVSGFLPRLWKMKAGRNKSNQLCTVIAFFRTSLCRD